MPDKPTTERPPVARVIIVDDHELVRAGLRSVLSTERGIEVIGEASNGREAVDLCRRERPDLVLMDVRMPEMDGLAATREVKAVSPSTSVIIVTMYEDPDYLLEALKAGAAGYVLKDAPERDLAKAVREVLRGESLLNPELAVRLLKRLAGEASTGAVPAPRERLTPREIEVVRLMAGGLTNRQIAEQLIVSISTVKAHVEHIIAKLEVSDRTQAAVRAVGLGLLNT